MQYIRTFFKSDSLCRNIPSLLQQGLLTVDKNPSQAAEYRESLHIGTSDILYCDSEILHLQLETLHIPHDYKKFDGIAHELNKIV